MLVKKVIIRELSKQQGVTGAKLSKSLSLMDSTHEDVIKLVTELNLRYRRRNEKQGVFDVASPTDFHNCYKPFHKSGCDKTFIEFSHTSAEDLRKRIEGVSAAKGGYLVYALYEDYRPYCSVFFVRDVTSIAFKRNKSVENFDLNKVEHIDFEKLAMACRINMGLFDTENSKYLSFINNQSDDVSQYFVRWISTCDTVTSEEDTTLFLKALKKIPIPEAFAQTRSREELIRSAHKAITASPTRTANAREISQTLFQDEKYLPDYLHQLFPTVPNEFKAHTSVLRTFVRVFAKADEVELNFYPSAFQKGTVRFDERDDTQIIIKSAAIVKLVKESLERE